MGRCMEHLEKTNLVFLDVSFYKVAYLLPKSETARYILRIPLFEHPAGSFCASAFRLWASFPALQAFPEGKPQ